MTSTIKSCILSTLEGGGFQDLCDTLLCAEGYEGIFSLGMKAGTLKTTIGNPDTYFRSKSGKYIFVAYTKEQTNINKKIKEDIEKCLDHEKTGVDIKDIEKIICRHTSSTLKAGDDQALRELCGFYGIELELYGIDRIADKIYRNYPYIAKDKLNLSIDSNQIFPMEEFIKRYDASIFRRYFSNLFNANYYTPEEVLYIYKDAEEDLKHIYFKCVVGCRYIDYRGTFLSGFILQNMDWIKWYARYIQETHKNYTVNDEEYRMDTCWKQENFLNIFDLFFDELLCDKSFYWHSKSYFYKVLSFDGKKEIDNRKEQWIIHYIRKKSDSENLIELFGILQDMKKEIRKRAILCFLECNSDYELFSHLSLVSNSWTGTSSLTDKIMFCEELLSEISGVQFLKHKKRIRDEIAKWKAVRNREEVFSMIIKNKSMNYLKKNRELPLSSQFNISLLKALALSFSSLMLFSVLLLETLGRRNKISAFTGDERCMVWS